MEERMEEYLDNKMARELGTEKFQEKKIEDTLSLLENLGIKTS